MTRWRSRGSGGRVLLLSSSCRSAWASRCTSLQEPNAREPTMGALRCQGRSRRSLARRSPAGWHRRRIVWREMGDAPSASAQPVLGESPPRGRLSFAVRRWCGLSSGGAGTAPGVSRGRCSGRRTGSASRPCRSRCRSPSASLPRVRCARACGLPVLVLGGAVRQRLPTWFGGQDLTNAGNGPFPVGVQRPPSLGGEIHPTE